MRTDGRKPEEIRPLTIEREYTMHPAGSVLVSMGKTKVLCTAMIENRVPRHCLDAGHGWVTAEYAMLPGSGDRRRSLRGSTPGRSIEISRLIGRCLRGIVDLNPLGRRTIWLDCNVIQADGGTRTASITGAYVALVDALSSLKEDGKIESLPILSGLGALSVGIVEGRAMVDLCAEEDRAASVDMNVVMTHDGRFVEVQGTAEKRAFDQEQHDEMLELVAGAMEEVKGVQMNALAGRLAT
jgi:ribonuclease PH